MLHVIPFLASCCSIIFALDELYVLNDGEQHKVVNGQVKINLKNGVEYKLMVYGKMDDDLNNLGATINVKAANAIPTEVSMNLSLLEKAIEREKQGNLHN